MDGLHLYYRKHYWSDKGCKGLVWESGFAIFERLQFLLRRKNGTVYRKNESLVAMLIWQKWQYSCCIEYAGGIVNLFLRSLSLFPYHVASTVNAKDWNPNSYYYHYSLVLLLLADNKSFNKIGVDTPCHRCVSRANIYIYICLCMIVFAFTRKKWKASLPL